jgi:hypothetical protein
VRASRLITPPRSPAPRPDRGGAAWAPPLA